VIFEWNHQKNDTSKNGKMFKTNKKRYAMKTIKFVPGIALAISASIFFTQGNLYSQTVILGGKGGISIPELKGGNTPQSQGYASRLAPNFGAFVDYEFNSELSLQLEVSFSGQGGRRDGMQVITSNNISGLPIPSNTNLYANFENETILNYLEIPLLWKYTVIRSNSGFSGYVDVGPYLGNLLNAKTKTSGKSNLYFDQAGTMPVTIQGQPLPPQNFDNETNIISDIKTSNAGISGGIGVTKTVGRGQLILDVRVTYGLIPIQEDRANGTNNTGALVVTLGYGIML